MFEHFSYNLWITTRDRVSLINSEVYIAAYDEFNKISVTEVYWVSTPASSFGVTQYALQGRELDSIRRENLQQTQSCTMIRNRSRITLKVTASDVGNAKKWSSSFSHIFQQNAEQNTSRLFYNLNSYDLSIDCVYQPVNGSTKLDDSYLMHPSSPPSIGKMVINFAVLLYDGYISVFLAQQRTIKEHRTFRTFLLQRPNIHGTPTLTPRFLLFQTSVSSFLL